MSLITVVIVLVLVGVGLWAVNRYIPMDNKIRTILNIVVVILVVLWLLKIFGLFEALSSIKV